MGEIYRGLIVGTVRVFVWMNCGILRKASAELVAMPNEIRTGNLPNTNLKLEPNSAAERNEKIKKGRNEKIKK